MSKHFKRYMYRGLPCNVVPRSELWCVSGRDTEYNSGGVLEWCTSEADAKAMLKEMLQYPRFKNLKVEKD